MQQLSEIVRVSNEISVEFVPKILLFFRKSFNLFLSLGLICRRPAWPKNINRLLQDLRGQIRANAPQGCDNLLSVVAGTVVEVLLKASIVDFGLKLPNANKDLFRLCQF